MGKYFKFLGSGRFWLSGPLAFVLSVCITASLSLLLPDGGTATQAGIDNLVFPMVLFPLTWVLAFFYPILESSKKRAVVVMVAVLLFSGSMVIASILGFWR